MSFIEGSWIESLQFDGKQYWDINEHNGFGMFFASANLNMRRWILFPVFTYLCPVRLHSTSKLTPVGFVEEDWFTNIERWKSWRITNSKRGIFVIWRIFINGLWQHVLILLFQNLEQLQRADVKLRKHYSKMSHDVSVSRWPSPIHLPFTCLIKFHGYPRRALCNLQCCNLQYHQSPISYIYIFIHLYLLFARTFNFTLYYIINTVY